VARFDASGYVALGRNVVRTTWAGRNWYRQPWPRIGARTLVLEHYLRCVVSLSEQRELTHIQMYMKLDSQYGYDGFLLETAAIRLSGLFCAPTFAWALCFRKNSKNGAHKHATETLLKLKPKLVQYNNNFSTKLIATEHNERAQINAPAVKAAVPISGPGLLKQNAAWLRTMDARRCCALTGCYIEHWRPGGMPATWAALFTIAHSGCVSTPNFKLFLLIATKPTPCTSAKWCNAEKSTCATGCRRCCSPARQP
jgi:hypothetical protein